MSLSEVSNILWRERQLLELLVFKLEEEQLVLAAGRNRWLPHATREVETVLGEIKRIELERAAIGLFRSVQIVFQPVNQTTFAVRDGELGCKCDRPVQVG